MVSCQLAVIGAGSAGCGAALAASRLGIDTILVENYQRIGGTSTFAGVNCYEPVAGATGISRRIFQEMQRNDSAGVGIYRITRHCMIPDEAAHPFPGSEQRIDSAGRYEDTLRSHMEEQEFSRALRLRRGIIFEPELFCRTVEGLLAQSGCCRLRTGVAPAAVECRDGVLRRMVLTDGTLLEAARWIDCTGAVAAQCGCRMLFGQEASGRYGESGAPKFPEPVLNGVSQIFRIRPAADDAVEPLPAALTSVGTPQRSSQPSVKDFPPQKYDTRPTRCTAVSTTAFRAGSRSSGRFSSSSIASSCEMVSEPIGIFKLPRFSSRMSSASF